MKAAFQHCVEELTKNIVLRSFNFDYVQTNTKITNIFHYEHCEYIFYVFYVLLYFMSYIWPSCHQSRTPLL